MVAAELYRHERKQSHIEWSSVITIFSWSLKCSSVLEPPPPRFLLKLPRFCKHGKSVNRTRSCIESSWNRFHFKTKVLYSYSERAEASINQNQPSRCVLRKSYSENIQHKYRRTLMPKCDYNKVAKLQSNFIEITLRHECSSVNLQHIFRTPFPKNTFCINPNCIPFNPFMTEAVCGSNQWTGFYMITASVMKGLNKKLRKIIAFFYNIISSF